MSLRVGPGELLVLRGVSGAGKSTLAALLLRLFDPSEGAITLDGHDLRDLRLASVRANVGALLQETLAFDASLRENIAYGRPDAGEEAILAAARAAGVDEFAKALPNGYETPIGQKGRRLSGGERRRVAIARLFLRDTPVVVLDDPFSGLDHDSAARLLGTLRRLREGRTMILIAHEDVVLREATTVAVLERGRLVAYGTPDELCEQTDAADTVVVRQEAKA